MRKRRPAQADGADPDVRDGAGHGAPGRRDDPEALAPEHGPGDDAGRVQDWCQRVEQEAPVGDQHLTDDDRAREQQLGHAVDPRELDVQLLGRRVEPAADLRREPRREQEDRPDRDGDDAHRPGEHRPSEGVGGSRVVAAEAREDRDEGRGQAGRHEDVEGDLRDPERRVVGIELGAGAVRVGEDAIAHDAQREVDERERREEQRPRGKDAVDQPAERGAGDALGGRGHRGSSWWAGWLVHETAGLSRP